MKKVLVISAFLSMLFGLSSAELRIIGSDENGIDVELDSRDIIIRPATLLGKTYQRITVDDLANTIDVGKPSLPQKTMMFAVPPDAVPQLESFVAEKAEWHACLPIPYQSTADSSYVLSVNRSIYSSKDHYPVKPIVLSNASWIRNNKVFTITFYPAVYDPTKGGITFSRLLKARIKFIRKQEALPSGQRKDVKDGIDDVFLKNIVNPAQASIWWYRPSTKAAGISIDTIPYKMLLDRDGIYKIEFSDLANAGLNPAVIDPRRIKLYNRGREIPVYFAGQADGVFDQDDYFEFYGQAIHGDSTYYHPYTDYNVYYLSVDGGYGARMIEEDGSPVNNVYQKREYFPDTLHFEKDSIFYRLIEPTSDQKDRWFWRRLDYPDSAIFSLYVPSPAKITNDSFSFKGYLHGITNDEHHIQISINGNPVMDDSWNYQSPYEFELKVPASILIDGINRVVVKHAYTLSSSNRVLVNWLELVYNRLPSVPEGKLEFASKSGVSDSSVQYQIAGLPSYNLDLYKIGVSKITGSEITLGTSGMDYTITFQDVPMGNERYYLVVNSPEYKLKPKYIINNDRSDIRDPNYAGSKYVIITSKQLATGADKLASLRQGRFPGAKVFISDDIYDEFDFGIPSDKAVKSFVEFAFANWSTQPEYILLLGDGSYDPKNLSGNSKADQIPVHLTRTDYYGGVANDDYYACVNGDDILPDIALGRLPLNDMEEFDLWDSKRDLYEKRLFLDQWHKDILFIAGWPLNPEDNFYVPSDRLAATIEPSFDVSKIYHGYSYQDKEDLILQLNRGSSVASFFGHGGAQLWSHGSFFWYYDVDRLDNWGRWPLIGSFTCLTGAYESPSNISMSESFLLNSGGAVGVFSSSGASYGDSVNGCALERTFVEAFNKKGLRLFGDIALSAKWEMAGSFPPSTMVLDMLTDYNLLGDPVVNLALPDTEIVMDISPKAVYPGDSVSVTVTGSFGAGTVLITLVDAQMKNIMQMTFSCPAGNAAATLVVPDSSATGPAKVKLYLKDANSDWVSSGDLGIGCSAISDYKTIPGIITDIDSIGITARFQTLDGLDSAWCEWCWGGYGDTTSLSNRKPMLNHGDTLLLADRIYLDGLEGSYQAGSDKYLIYRISVSDTLGNISSGEIRKKKIMRRPDPTPSGTSQGSAFLGGKRVLSFYTRIKNLGDIDAVSIPVSIYQYGNDSLLSVASLDSLPPDEERLLCAPWHLEGQFSQVTYVIDPLKTMLSPYPQEDTTNDRSVVLWVPHQDFYYYQLNGNGFNQDTLNFYDKIKAFFQDSCLHDSAVAVIGSKNIDLESIKQAGLIPLDSMGLAYFVSLTDSSRTFDNGRGISVSLKLENVDSNANLADLKLMRYDDLSGVWQMVNPSSVEGGYISGYSSKPGTFMAMFVSDTTGPKITAKVDQQALGWEKTIMVSNPQYSVLFEDPDGVNIDSIWVELDGNRVPNTMLSLPRNSENVFSIPLIYSPYLSNGRHLLKFGAADNLGNRSTSEMVSLIDAGFTLREIANYPNPVNGKATTFYFYVGDIADRYELKVYTVAGRLIKSFFGGTTSGVKTFDWDLNDESGNLIANGVYFYSVKVFKDERMAEMTGKMAILR